jgi:hypothetical protein
MFFSELTQSEEHKLVDFVDTKTIIFSPDNNINDHPEDIEWMKDKVDELKIKGKSLHATFFVKETRFHEYIQLFGLTCVYSFNADKISGTCEVLFEFSGHSKSNDNLELTLNVVMFKLYVNDSGLSRIKIEKKILQSLETKKLELYEKYKI